jgi:PIN domain nuclease of toxin-antitoxin system
VNLLLDTHIWLWLKTEQEHRIPSPVRRKISRDSSTLYLSVACVMEIAIKHAIGKLRLDIPAREFVERLLAQGALPVLIGIEHAMIAGSLPLHHRDPFDRTIIAQAKVDDLTIVTADPRILRYDVPTIDARK